MNNIGVGTDGNWYHELPADTSGECKTAYARYVDSTLTGDRCYANGDTEYARCHWLDAMMYLSQYRECK